MKKWGGGFTFFHYAIIEEIEKLFSPIFYARICNFALEIVTLHKTLRTHYETTHLVR